MGVGKAGGVVVAYWPTVKYIHTYSTLPWIKVFVGPRKFGVGPQILFPPKINCVGRAHKNLYPGYVQYSSLPANKMIPAQLRSMSMSALLLASRRAARSGTSIVSKLVNGLRRT